MGGGPIVVDGVFFQQDIVTGIARVWREVLGQWAQCDMGRRVVLLNRGRLPEGLEKITTRDCPPLDYDRWQDGPAVVQGICDELGAALFLSTYYTHPARTPSIMWVHDMIPERLGYDLAHPVWRQKHAAIAHAAAYACASANTLRDLRALFPDTAPKPAAVVGSGVSAAMYPASAAERLRFEDSFIRPKLRGRPYIIVPGHTHAYKNGRLLVEVLSRLDCSGLAVLLTMESPDMEQLQKIPGLEVHCEQLSESDLRLAYSGAHCLVYPSLYEGFGLPVIEAMACGCPVICSNTSSLPEVAGDAALLMDPTRPEQLIDALAQMSRPEVRQTLIERGLRRAKNFTWAGVTADFEVLVFDVLQEPGWWVTGPENGAGST